MAATAGDNEAEMTKKKQAVTPQKYEHELEQRIMRWMLSRHLEGEPINVAPGARLIAISQSVFNLEELIRDGRFSPSLCQVLQMMISSPTKCSVRMPIMSCAWSAATVFGTPYIPLPCRDITRWRFWLSSAAGTWSIKRRRPRWCVKRIEQRFAAGNNRGNCEELGKELKPIL